MKLTPELIAEMAQEVESGDPIDWGMLAVDEQTAYNLMATSMLEHYNSLDEESRDLMLLATATKLVVENMVLNLKLQHK
jgi:hypothetical protein